MANLIVEINEGKLKGKLCKTSKDIQYLAFKGIPYAKPPVNELRFAVTQPPESWEGIRDATINPNICAQLDRATNTIIGDEDCLYLNVYTPKLPTTSNDTPLPVMVYFHGGGFLFGSGTDDSVHGPDFLIEKNVILIGLNYRLGILGFLSLDRKEATGNMGLKDQIQALKWIQENIKSFNGDPNNVTLFGISAGAAAIEYLLLSPLTKSLFHKVIMQSGSTLNPWTYKNNISELAFEIPAAKGLNITDADELYRYLLDLPIKELITLSLITLKSSKHKGGLDFGFVPTLEKPIDWEPVFKKDTYELLTKGEFIKVPTIMGYCSNEGLLMLANIPDVVQNIVENKQMTKYLPFKMNDTEIKEIEAKLTNVYLQKKNAKDPDEFALEYLGDLAFCGGIYTTAKLISKYNATVFFYEFSYDGGLNYLKKKLNINRSGACHGDDGGYLIKSNILSEDISDVDKLVQTRMIEMWTTFAKTGNPTPSVNDIITTKWKTVAGENINYLQINDKLTIKENIETPCLKLFENLYSQFNGLKK